MNIYKLLKGNFLTTKITM